MNIIDFLERWREKNPGVNYCVQSMGKNVIITLQPATTLDSAYGADESSVEALRKAARDWDEKYRPYISLAAEVHSAESSSYCMRCGFGSN